jgi:hypothetical protein
MKSELHLSIALYTYNTDKPSFITPEYRELTSFSYIRQKSKFEITPEKLFTNTGYIVFGFKNWVSESEQIKAFSLMEDIPEYGISEIYFKTLKEPPVVKQDITSFLGFRPYTIIFEPNRYNRLSPDTFEKLVSAEKNKNLWDFLKEET